MNLLTSKELLEAAEIRDIGTLTRWHQEKLIPEPEIRTHPNGRGKLGYWPAWVVEHCKAIKEKRQQNFSLAEIAKFYGSNWELLAARYTKKTKRKYSFAKVNKQMDLSLVAAKLTETVEAISDAIGRKCDSQLVSHEMIEFGLGLLIDGMNPVLVVLHEQATVTADFAVSQYLSNHYSSQSAITVIPMLEICRKHLSAYGIPRSPFIKPIPIVENKGKDCNFLLNNDLGFDLGVPKGRSATDSKKATKPRRNKKSRK